MRILEIGCGSGSFWTENKSRLPEDLSVVLSDISPGMIRDVRREIGDSDRRFTFIDCDAQQIPLPEDSFDLVIANHVLFYTEDPAAVCREVFRVLNGSGRFLCSTYGREHMQEVTALVREFDSRIVLSGEKLFDRFGLENGMQILSDVFPKVTMQIYPDSLNVDSAGPLIEYILSCHGNQNQYIIERFKEFRSFVQKKTAQGFYITKQAGAFLARKNSV